jgi:hypothetical protein
MFDAERNSRVDSGSSSSDSGWKAVWSESTRSPYTCVPRSRRSTDSRAAPSRCRPATASDTRCAARSLSASTVSGAVARRRNAATATSVRVRCSRSAAASPLPPRSTADSRRSSWSAVITSRPGATTASCAVPALRRLTEPRADSVVPMSQYAVSITIGGTTSRMIRDLMDQLRFFNAPRPGRRIDPRHCHRA